MSDGITGADFAAVAAALQQHSPELRKALTKGIGEAAKPVREQMRAAVTGLSTSSSGSSSGGSKARLAHQTRNQTRNMAEAAATGKRLLSAKAFAKAQARSGLRASVARGVRIETRTKGDAGVRIRSASSAMPPDQRKLPRHMNKGTWRHPVYGGPGWAEQTVSPEGWFDKTAEKSGPTITAAVVKAIETSAKDLAAKLSAAN